MYCLCMGIFADAQEDLKVEINQAAFNDVLSSVKYPFTMFERTYPFHSISNLPATTGTSEGEFATRTLSKDSSILYFQWAVENRNTIPASAASGVDNEFKEALQLEWESMKAEIKEILDEHNRNLGTAGYRFPLQGYTAEELAKIQKAGVKETIDFFTTRDATAFIVRVHLAFLRLNLNEQPSLIVKSPVFGVTGIKVNPTATVQLWVKLPVFRCCPPRITWKWKPTLSLTVSPDIAADANVTFSQSNMKVVGRAAFTRLVLDYPILRHLNFATIANRSMKDFEVYDASAFMASLPYINSRFRIESLSLPPNQHGLTIAVNIIQSQPAMRTAGTN